MRSIINKKRKEKEMQSIYIVKYIYKKKCV